MDIIKITDL